VINILQIAIVVKREDSGRFSPPKRGDPCGDAVI
jgi:hypothetical protein